MLGLNIFMFKYNRTIIINILIMTMTIHKQNYDNKIKSLNNWLYMDNWTIKISLPHTRGEHIYSLLYSK